MSMREFVNRILEAFPEEIGRTASRPARKLRKKQAVVFHDEVARWLFLSVQARRIPGQPSHSQRRERTARIRPSGEIRRIFPPVPEGASNGVFRPRNCRRAGRAYHRAMPRFDRKSCEPNDDPNDDHCQTDPRSPTSSTEVPNDAPVYLSVVASPPTRKGVGRNARCPSGTTVRLPPGSPTRTTPWISAGTASEKKESRTSPKNYGGIDCGRG